jgi:hypothetical protein
MKTVICLAVLLFLGASCEKEYYFGPEDQPVYFEYHYVNNAWGVADNGWLVDQEGNMRGFDFPEDYRWPDSEGYLSLEDLEYNLGQTDTLLRTFKRQEFTSYSRLIGGASRGPLSESRVRGADMGSASLACFAWDRYEGKYKYILLIRAGDWEQQNLSEEAEILVNWLKEYGVAFLSD